MQRCKSAVNLSVGGWNRNYCTIGEHVANMEGYLQVAGLDAVDRRLPSASFAALFPTESYVSQQRTRQTITRVNEH